MDQNFNNDDDILAYSKSDWIKVSFENRLKRIYHPPKTLDELLTIL